MMNKLIDLTGQKFGRLTVIERSDNVLVGNQSKTAWKCICDCGKEIVVASQYLRNGDTKSCGCFQREFAGRKHGFSKTRLYGIWCGIIRRCCNENDQAYRNYGGRGIKVCDEWKNNFMSFRKWALENGYSDKLSIDRIDNNGNYEPSNCRWATQMEQANNMRCNRILVYNGESHTAAEWGRITGLGGYRIRSRLHSGFTVEEAITLPKMKGRLGRKNIESCSCK